MNILEFVQTGNKVKTLAGHDVKIESVEGSIDYPIEGVVLFETFKKVAEYKCKWDINGMPFNQENNHDLRLVAIVPDTPQYKTLSPTELANLSHYMADCPFCGHTVSKADMYET